MENMKGYSIMSNRGKVKKPITNDRAKTHPFVKDIMDGILVDHKRNKLTNVPKYKA